jgi:hypothetical protein
MVVIAILAIILFLAFLVEALVEYIFGQIAEHVEAAKPYQWLLAYVALIVGVITAFIYHFDLVYLLAQFMEDYAPGVLDKIPQTSLGITLTGLAIGRGSSFIHDIITQFFVKPTSSTTKVTVQSSSGESASVLYSPNATGTTGSNDPSGKTP